MRGGTRDEMTEPVTDRTTDQVTEAPLTPVACRLMEGHPGVKRIDADMGIGGDELQDPQRDPGLQLGEHAPTPPSIDGFQRALILEQQALHDALSTAPHLAQERLIPLIAELYSLLRTPIFPKRGYRTLAAALVTTVLGDDNGVHLHGVLASPTAETELNRFLDCAMIFRRHGFTPQVRLLLLQWDNLVEMHHQDARRRTRAFARHVRAVTEAARHAGLVDAVIPVEIEVDAETAEILTPADFRDWSHRVLAAVHEPGSACPALVRDVVWSTGFYARQVSLSRLGEKQALLDLALRRASGHRVSAEHASHRHRDGSVLALLTAERHKRLLPCYAASVPILNLATGERRGTASTSAVA
jgi:hypothetical protein